jgi:uncharacterized repeat protein (TIGR01451 family)
VGETGGGYRSRYPGLFADGVEGLKAFHLWCEMLTKFVRGKWLVVGAGQLLICCALLVGLWSRPPTQAQTTRRVNAPRFEGDIPFSEMAVFWFGRVGPTENYADVRVGYNDQLLSVRVAAFDRRLWYDTSPSAAELAEWDAVTLYLDANLDGGDTPRSDGYRFVAQLNWWEERDAYQAVYQGNGSSWVIATIPFTATSGWRGNAPNDSTDDRGWAMTFLIPFESLGLAGPPDQGTVWGMAVVLHDRDDAVGTPIADKAWPEGTDGSKPGTWAELAFGIPTYTPPSAIPGGAAVIREKLNGAIVPDAAVGGTMPDLCPGDSYYIWNVWGNANYGDESDFNVQNQSDVADWPCFAKYYVTFPLDAVPPGKVVISATLTLHQFGGSEPSQAEPSLIQVLMVDEAWDEASITWNNAPLALENVSSTWVDTTGFPGWPGIPRTWDVSRAVAEAYEMGTPLRLVLYEADDAYHSGKHFVASETGDWNEVARPTLRVLWGDPVGAVDKAASSTIVMPGDTLTYTLNVVGSGQPLTVTDQLPAGVSAPISYSPGLTYTPHRLSWSGQLAAGEPITLTYVVTVTAPSRAALWNQAVLAQSDGSSSEAAVMVLVDPARIYLPLVVKAP